jgi:predicted aspartyl protease
MIAYLTLLMAAPTQVADAPPPPPTQCAAARKMEMRPLAEVRVNGRGPYKFIVDTGSDSSAVGLNIARGLRLPAGKPVILNGMTSRAVIGRVRVGELTVGAATLRDLQVPALSEADLGGDGVLGMDALAGQRLVVDFEQRRILVEDGRKPAIADPAEMVISARPRRGGLILTGLKAGGIPIDTMIQTGSEISIGNPALRDRLLGKSAPAQSVEVIGANGAPVSMELARVSELALGPLTFRDVPIAFAKAPPFGTWAWSTNRRC